MRPSGRDLTRLIADAVADSGVDEWVVELGGGTGAVTRALLDAGIPRDRLVVLERDAALSAWLRRDFPGTTVIAGDAEQLGRHLARREISGVRRIVSSLPLLSIPKGPREAILAEIFSVLGTDGSLIQYSYGPTCPVSRSFRNELGLTARAVGTAWRNLPPARVWELRKRESGVSGAASSAEAA